MITAHDFSTQFHNTISQVISGQSKVIRAIAISILAKGHILLEGVPGTGKTLIARCIAKTLGFNFSRIQFTPDLMPSDVLGTNIFDFQSKEFRLVKGPIFAHMILGDEINRAPPKTQAALLEAMQERQVTIDGNTHILPNDFFVIATQNPIEQEGTYPLPEAQLDRFLCKVVLDYPNQEEEAQLLEASLAGIDAHISMLSTIQPICEVATIDLLRNQLTGIVVKPSILKYIYSIISATRQSPYLSNGASPRAGIHLLVSSRWEAALNGHEYVTPDDVQTMLSDVIAHRLTLTPEAELEGFTARSILKQILEKIEVPR